MYWELLSFYKLFPCTEDFVNVYEFPLYWGLWIFTISHLHWRLGFFMRFIFPCTRDLQTFLPILELCIFTDFPLMLKTFFYGIPYVLETLRLYKLSSYTGDFELLLISLCTGDYEFLSFPLYWKLWFLRGFPCNGYFEFLQTFPLYWGLWISTKMSKIVKNWRFFTGYPLTENVENPLTEKIGRVPTTPHSDCGGGTVSWQLR